MTRRLRWWSLGFFLYLAVCGVGGVYLADGTLRPARRPLTDDEVSAMHESARALGATMEETAFTTSDGVTLRAWKIRPHSSNGDDVLLFHGLGDNRVGMTGYAHLFASHGFTVLLPDARAHGTSGGELATYGLLERNDIHDWLNLLENQDHPHCVYGFGESMGAAQLLQSLATRPNFCAVAAESSFATFREIAYDRMGQPFHLGPWLGRTVLRPLVEMAFLRARWKYGLKMQQISPEDSVATTDMPVLLIHGQADSNIPIQHSRRIRGRNPNVRLWEVPGADHCGAIVAAPQEFEQRLLTWFTSRSHQQTALRY